MSVTNTLASVANLSLAFIVLIPILWQMPRGNVGACAFAIWASLACTCVGVNAVTWKGSVGDISSVWCDISTRIIIGAYAGFPAASMVIIHRLYRSVSMRQVMLQDREKRYMIIADLSICFGIPIMVIAFYYIVQMRRYDIFEDIGCMPTMMNTPLTYGLIFAWPVVLGLYMMVLCPFIIHALLAQRVSMAKFPSASRTRMHRNFVRLVVLTCSVVALSLPPGFIAAWLFSESDHKITKWPGMSNVHQQIAHVNSIHKSTWSNSAMKSGWLYWHQWIFVAAAALFLLFFGFTEEARAWYSSGFRWCTDLPLCFLLCHHSRARKRRNSIAPEPDDNPEYTTEFPQNNATDTDSIDVHNLAPLNPVSNTPPVIGTKLQLSPTFSLEFHLYDIRESRLTTSTHSNRLSPTPDNTKVAGPRRTDRGS